MGTKNKVEKWLAEGLIGPEQAEAILKREKFLKAGPPQWSLSGFLLVAVFSAGIGFIALVAANWHVISPVFKLAGYFLILSGTGFFAFQTRKNHSVYFESLLVFFMILCLAGIGLISQIYNIRGEPYEVFFLWSVMTTGLLFLNRWPLVDHLWLGGVFIAVSTWGISVWSESWVYKMVLLHPLAFLFLFLVLHNRWVGSLSSFLKLKREVLGEWTLITGLVSLAFFHGDPKGVDLSFVEIFVLACVIGCVSFAVWMGDFKRVSKIIIQALLCLFFVFYLSRFLFPLNSLALMIFSSLKLSVVALLFASLGKKSLFLFFVAALIFRILFFYMAVFKSLTLTGFVLILFGVVIVGMVYIFKKNRERFLLWIKRFD